MRRYLPFLVLAACGGDSKSHPDAAVPPIDGRPIDGPVDAMVDAPPDAPAVASARLWVVGDFVTNNTTIAGSFLDTAMLPLTAPLAVQVPATGELYDLPGAVTVFDAAGGKIAFVANATDAARYDLYVANADGSSPTLLVQGQTGLEIPQVTLSPDATKVAFLMDSAAVNDGYDLWVVDTTGTGTPVQLSPARPAAALNQDKMDVFSVSTWSADSRYIGFSGDLTESDYDQAYVVDTAATTPAAVELLARADIATQTPAGSAQGVRGAVQFDNAGNAWFRARTIAGSPLFQLFRSTLAGSRTQVTLPARADATTPDAGAFSITPDGATLLFSVDAPLVSRYDLYKVATAGGTPTNLTNLAASGRASFSAPMWLSPDGSKVAVIANFLSTRNDPYVINLDGSGMHRLVNAMQTCAACGSPDAEVLQWVGNSTIFATGDLTANNDTKLYRLDATATEQTPVLALDVPMGGDLLRLIAVAP